MSEAKETGLATSIPRNVSIYNADDANHMFMLAKQFSQSSLVPKHFQKKPRLFSGAANGSAYGRRPVHGSAESVRCAWATGILSAVLDCDGE